MPVGRRARTGVQLHHQPGPQERKNRFHRDRNVTWLPVCVFATTNGVHGPLADTLQCLLWHTCVCFKSELHRAPERCTTRVQETVSLEPHTGSDRRTSQAELSQQPCHARVTNSYLKSKPSPWPASCTTASHVSPPPL